MKSSLGLISVQGYKSIRALENLKLGSLNVFIGANGSGKTNFISLFRLLNRIVNERLQFFVGQAGGADALLYFGQRTTDEIAIDLTFGLNGYTCRLSPAAGDTLIFASEGCWYHDRLRYPSPYVVQMGSGHRETKLYTEARDNGTIARHVLDAMGSWQVYHFHDTSESARVKKAGETNDNAYLRPDASNLAAFLYLLREAYPDHYRKIVDTVRLAAPFFDDFVLRPDPLNPDKIRLEWRENGSDAYFNANTLSDGTLRFICLATLLLQPDLPATILIDEPELGLHPYAITLLAALLRSAAAQTQVVVSTQSVTLVNQFGPEDIVVVDREGRQSTFGRLSEHELEVWLDEYGVGDLWEKNLLGGRPA